MVPKGGLEPPHPCGHMTLNRGAAGIAPLSFSKHFTPSRRSCSHFPRSRFKEASLPECSTGLLSRSLRGSSGANGRKRIDACPHLTFRQVRERRVAVCRVAVSPSWLGCHDGSVCEASSLAVGA